MPRRATIQARPLEPDPVYSSRLVTQVINKVMSRGKKSSAERIVYRALDRIGEQTGKPPVEVLEQAIKTVTPVLEVRSTRARPPRPSGSSTTPGAPTRWARCTRAPR